MIIKIQLHLKKIGSENFYYQKKPDGIEHKMKEKYLLKKRELQ